LFWNRSYYVNLHFPMKKCQLVFLLVAIFSFSSFAQNLTKDEIFQKNYNKRIKKERLYGVYIPKDVPDAFAQLNKLTPREAKANFKSVPEEVAVKKLHFSLGRWIIHNWGFYEGSRLSHHLRQIGVAHPDDQARVIITVYHRYLNKTPLAVKELATYYTEKRRKELEEKKKQHGQVLSKEVRKKQKG